jgi:hypothetical protein
VNPTIETALGVAMALIEAVRAARAKGIDHVDVDGIIAGLHASIVADDAAAESALDKKFPK